MTDPIIEQAQALPDDVLAVLDEAIAAVEAEHQHRCPSYGHWEPFGTQTEADRPDRYTSPQVRREDCADDQCRNRDHVKYVLCTNPWHLAEEGIAELHRVRAAVAGLLGVIREQDQAREPSREAVFVSLPSGTDIARWFKGEDFAGRFQNPGGDAIRLSENPHSALWKLAEVDRDEQMFYLLEISTDGPDGATTHDLLFVSAGLREEVAACWRNEPTTARPEIYEALTWFASQVAVAEEHLAMIDARKRGVDPLAAAGEV